MKKLLFFGLISGLFSTASVNSQIYVNEGFNNHPNNLPTDWTREGSFVIGESESTTCNNTRHIKVNLYESETQAKLFTPIYTSDGTDLTLKFKYRVVNFTSGAATPGSYFDLNIDYSIDGGTNWTTKENVGGSNHTATTDCTDKTINFTAGEIPSGSNVQFRFHGVRHNGDFYLTIDDVKIMQSATVPACPSNTTFTENRSGCGNYGGKITWDSTMMTDAYKVKIGTTPGGNEIYEGTQTATEYNIATSTAGQTFYYTIQATNDLGTSTGCIENSYMMPNENCYCEVSSDSPDERYIKSFKTTNGLSNIDNQDNGYSNSGYSDFSSQIVESYENGFINFEIKTDGNAKVSMWVDFNNNYTFEESEKILDAASSENSNNHTVTGGLSIPSGINNGNYRIRVRTNSIFFGNPPACGNKSYGETEDYTLTISDAPSCPPANQLNATLGSVHAANLSWNGDASGTYQIEWGAEGFTQGSGTTVDDISGLTYQLTEFPTLNTNYSYYVRKKCSTTEFSDWVGPYTFYVGYCMPSISDNDGTGIPEVTINGVSFTQGDVTYANHYDNPVDLNAGTTIPVSINFGMNQTQKYGVWLDSNDDFSFDSSEKLTSGSVNNTPTTESFTIDIPAGLTEGVHHLRIYTGGYGVQDNPCYESTYSKGVLLDFAINITSDTVCITPYNLSTEGATGGKKLLWAGNGNNYSIEYGPTGFTQGQGTVVNNISTNEHVITGLTENTNYEFYVKNNCVGGTTTWVGPKEFFYGYCQSQPTSIDDNGIVKVIIYNQEFTQGNVTYYDHTSTPVDVQQGLTIPIEVHLETGYPYYTHVWIDLNKDLVFDINERTQIGNGSSGYDNPAVVNGSITLPSDLANGDYRMRLISKYGSNNTDNPCYSGNDAATLEFTLHVDNGNLGTNTKEITSLKMYPNPANDIVYFSCKETINSIEIFDINGRRVYNTPVNATTTQVNVSNLATGSYIVRIHANGKTQTEQLIIK